MLSEFISQVLLTSAFTVGLHVRAVSVFVKKSDAVCGFRTPLTPPQQAHHGGYENSSTLKRCKPIKNSEKKLIYFRVAKSLVEEPSYNANIAEILCWKGQDKQTGI